ncbi:hypothetical protein RJ639_040432 [Escallonia herrerae]|uniref:MPN domain-containing protein n=1 Tax=Escallonia herrerae TaxID=1293975 RepID=A0AA88WGH9_9ASTE|nr:hypothetical protein RJ639_040432 [Escallonia herrerae]
MKLYDALSELEELKPAVQQKIKELRRKHTYQLNGHNNSLGSSLESPYGKKQNMNGYALTKVGLVHCDSGYLTSYLTSFVCESLSIPRPKEETLSRHSIFGPNGLRGQWQPPPIYRGVQYPSNIDLTPIEIPSLRQPVEDGVVMKTDFSNSELEKSSSISILPPSSDQNQTRHAEEPGSLISFETIDIPLQADIIRQPSPPPVLADVQDLIPATSPPVAEAQIENPSSDGLFCSESPLELHISTTLMNSFMKLAKSNTDKNLETCGILAGSLKNRKFYITALIIPKQESTPDSCQTTNEEEIFEVQDKQSLFPLGWIHTHPTQSCFMSSIDLHTHYSYQIMLPESIAVVMAPRDSSRTHGIFRLTTPGGMGVIRQCPRRGFHPHDPPSDGGPIYKQCTDVYMNSNLKFDVIDLR